MKMRIFSLTALVLLMLSVTAQALEPQATGGNPVLTFSGTTAQCSITCTGNKSTDQVEAKLTLYQGGAYVDSWDGSGKFRASVHGDCAVKKCETYTLVLTWSVNGTKQPSASTTKVCQ